jgi:serine/threonine-protein kinase
VLQERYEILGFVDSGGTADVYLAQDQDANDLVVIKQLSRKMAGDPRVREHFLREATTAKSIEHPHVVRVLDVVEPADDSPFLVLEALAGETLGDYLRREGALRAEPALRFAAQAAYALQASHGAGIVHRDVKPDNLFLVGELGNPRLLKLIDFGMAHVEHVPGASESVVLGTVQYMAPEQVLTEPVDARTDVYGLGVVMFRMVTGHLPFDSEPTADMLRHQLFSAPPPASWLADDLSPLVDALILRAMRKHPANRHQHMGAFLQELEEALGPGEQAKDDRLAVSPDVYEPQSESGRTALRTLAKRFGRFASLPDSALVEP